MGRVPVSQVAQGPGQKARAGAMIKASREEDTSMTVTTATKLEKGYLLQLLRSANAVLAELQTNVKVLPSQYNANRKSSFTPPCRGKGVVKVS